MLVALATPPESFVEVLGTCLLDFGEGRDEYTVAISTVIVVNDAEDVGNQVWMTCQLVLFSKRSW